MIDLKKYLIKYRYGHFLRIFFDILSKFGIRITFYYTFREMISLKKPQPPSIKFKNLKISCWGPEEIKAMALIPGRKFSEENLLKRLKEGQKCFGVIKENEIIAFTWCNFKEMTFGWHRTPLKKNEVYIYDAFTLIEYRGKGIAPFLRYNCYKELAKIGMKNLYSHTDYFNTPAMNFKLKLNAKKEKLSLYVVFFTKWPFHFILKDYQK